MKDQKTLRLLPSGPIFVGFAGRIGAGKTSASRYLASTYDFDYIRYSEVLEEWTRTPVSHKKLLQEEGWKVMGGGMQLELNARLVSRLDRSRSTAVDGLRHPIDYESLTAAIAPKFFLIFIESSESCRFQRLGARFDSLAKFNEADAMPVEAFINQLKPLASFTLLNNGPLQHLHDKLDRWLENLQQEGDK